MPSLWSSIGNAVTTAFYKVADPILTTFAHPIKVAEAIVSPTKTIAQVENEFFSQPKSSQIAQTIFAGVNYGLAGAGAGALATKGVVSAVGGISLKTVGKVALTEVAGSTISKSPTLQNQVVQLPNAVDQFTSNIANTIETPTLENGLRILKDNPFLSATAITALLVSLGYSASLIASILSTRANTNAVKENTEQNKNPQVNNTTQTANPNASAPVINYYVQTVPPTTPPIYPDTPPSPSVEASQTTAPVGHIKKKAKKKKAKKKTRRSKKKKKSIKRRKR